MRLISVLAWGVFTEVCFLLCSGIIAMHVSPLGEGGDPAVSCVDAWKGEMDVYEFVGKRSWQRLAYGCVFLLTLPLHAKCTFPQNKFPEVGFKLVAKGSAGSSAAPGSRSWSPLPRCTQPAPSRWHPLWMCSHQWKQMAVGNYSCSQPDVPAVHALHWSSVPSFLFFAFHLHKICLLLCPGGGFYPAEQGNNDMCSCSSYDLGHCFPSYTKQWSLPKCQPKGM